MRLYALAPTVVSRTSLPQTSPFTVISIMKPPLRRLLLPGVACLTMHLFSRCRLTFTGDRVIGRIAQGIWNAPSNLIHAMCGCFRRSEEHTSELQSRGHLV